MSAPNSFSDDSDDWSSYREAVDRLTGRIAAGHEDASQAAMHARARRRLAHLERFLAELDDPQRRIPVVHVTGTSGKGSTATGIAALLTAAGMKTGLATSPFLQAATEKLQIDGRLIGGAALSDLLDDVESIEARMLGANPEEVPLTYGELWPALALRWFDLERVDAAVIEVGAGGRLDPTNVVRPIGSVITGVGYDHVATLGPTLADIAWHKAGIIKPGAPVVVGPLPPEAWPVVEREAAAAAVDVIRVAAETAGPPTNDDAPFVAANHRLALATAHALAERGVLDPSRIDPSVLSSARLPGRLEAMPQPIGAPAVVLDGAHNPQKIAALRDDLDRRGAAGSPRPVIVFAALAGKATSEMLSILAPAAAGLVNTSASVLGKPAANPTELVAVARSVGFPGPAASLADPEAALDTALEIAALRGTWVLVTGSLYLLGALRGRWYPVEAVVRQRTPWPDAHALPIDGAATGGVVGLPHGASRTSVVGA